jgi:hypothetical protein
MYTLQLEDLNLRILCALSCTGALNIEECPVCNSVTVIL